MKKSLFIAPIVGTLILISCSQTPEEKLVSDKQDYIGKAQAYMQNVLDESEDDCIYTSFTINKPVKINIWVDRGYITYCSGI